MNAKKIKTTLARVLVALSLLSTVATSLGVTTGTAQLQGISVVRMMPGPWDPPTLPG